MNNPPPKDPKQFEVTGIDQYGNEIKEIVDVPVEPITDDEIYKPLDFYSKSHAVHRVLKDGHSMLTGDVVNDLNNYRRGFLQQRQELAEQQQKIERLSMHVKWAINHYGVVNTDGIFKILRDAITELEQQALAPRVENE